MPLSNVGMVTTTLAEPANIRPQDKRLTKKKKILKY